MSEGYKCDRCGQLFSGTSFQKSSNVRSGFILRITVESALSENNLDMCARCVEAETAHAIEAIKAKEDTTPAASASVRGEKGE